MDQLRVWVCPAWSIIHIFLFVLSQYTWCRAGINSRPRYLGFHVVLRIHRWRWNSAMKSTRCRYRKSRWRRSWEWKSLRRRCRSTDIRRWTHNRTVRPSTHNMNGSVGGRWYRWSSISVDPFTFTKGQDFGRWCRHFKRHFLFWNIHGICPRIRDHRRRSRLHRSSSENRGLATMRHLGWLSRSTAGGNLDVIFPLQLHGSKDEIRQVNI